MCIIFDLLGILLLIFNGPCLYKLLLNISDIVLLVNLSCYPTISLFHLHLIIFAITLFFIFIFVFVFFWGLNSFHRGRHLSFCSWRLLLIGITRQTISHILGPAYLLLFLWRTRLIFLWFRNLLFFGSIRWFTGFNSGGLRWTLPILLSDCVRWICI